MSELEQIQYIKKSKIEENLKFFESSYHTVFGKIILFKNNSETKKLIMKKKKKVFSNYDCKLLIDEISNIMKYECENILKPLDYNIKKLDEEEYEINCFFDFKENNLKNEIKKRELNNNFFQKEKLVNFLEDILKVYKFFEKKNIFISDLNPENIFLDDINILAPNFKKIKNPFKAQIKKLTEKTDIYLSPFLFNFLLSKNTKLIFNPYKALNFTLGLILLETGNLKSIQNIYDFENKIINYNNLLNHINRFISIYQNCEILKKIIFSLLEMDFAKRKSIAEIYEMLIKLKMDQKNFFSKSQNNFKKVETIDIDSANNLYNDLKNEKNEETENEHQYLSRTNTLERDINLNNNKKIVDFKKYPFNQKKILKQSQFENNKNSFKQRKSYLSYRNNSDNKKTTFIERKSFHNKNENIPKPNFENNNGIKSYTSNRDIIEKNNKCIERKSYTSKLSINQKKNHTFIERKSFTYKNDNSENKKNLSTSINYVSQQPNVSYKKRIFQKINKHSQSFINSKISPPNLKNNFNLDQRRKIEPFIKRITKKKTSKIEEKENELKRQRKSVIEEAKSKINRRTIYVSCERQNPNSKKYINSIKNHILNNLEKKNNIKTQIKNKIERINNKINKIEKKKILKKPEKNFKANKKIMAHEIYIPNSHLRNRKSLIKEKSEFSKGENKSISEIDKFPYKISKSPNQSRKYILTRSQNSVLNRVKSRSINKNGKDENNFRENFEKISNFNDLEGGLTEKFDNLELREKRVNFQVFRVVDDKDLKRDFKAKYQTSFC